METLSSLSRGIYPRLLSDEGLVTALRSAVGSSPIPVTIEADEVGRLPTAMEAALYFCCMEAVQNATKHSSAQDVTVRLKMAQGRWQLTVRDDGVGFDPEVSAFGAGLVNMRDRLDAVGGAVTVESLAGVGTTITAVLPVTEGADPTLPLAAPVRGAV
jgi:signal transduction histidine kinase